jgi:hypothetical protein
VRRRRIKDPASPGLEESRQHAGLRASLTRATIPLHLRSHDAPTAGGRTMSGWQELKAERNRRSLVRLNKALPPIFPRAVLARAFARPFVPPTPRLAVESYWRSHPIRAGIAWREHLQLAAKRPIAGLGVLATAGAACPSRSARHPRHTVKSHTHWARDFVACAANRFIA